MADFETRLQARIAEMRKLYNEIYPGQDEMFEELLTEMKQSYNSRSQDLKALDNRRESNPLWYKEEKAPVGYIIYVNNFSKDLKGLVSKLPYLQSLGVSYVHLMPLLKSPKGESDGGYAVSSYRMVEPELGTTEDLKEVSEKFHEKGINLCLDFVMNHTSSHHMWAQKALKGEKRYMDMYYFLEDGNKVKEIERSIPDVFPTTAPGSFTYLPFLKKYVMTMFYPFQWDLNYTNPHVFNMMASNLLFLANLGIDIFRLDAVPYIWKKWGTDCRNLPQVHTLVRLYRLVCECVCPGTLLLGEVVMEPSKVVPYFGSEKAPECHMLYNVTTMATVWHTVATKDVRLLKRQCDAIKDIGKEYFFLNYIRCHDDIGWGLDYPYLEALGMYQVPHKKFLNDYFTGKLPYSWSKGETYNDDPTIGDARLCGTTASLCGIEKAYEEKNQKMLNQGLKLDLMLHAFVFSLSGLPMIYSGDEIGRFNDNDYKKDPEKKDDSRYIHRGIFEWGKVKNIQEKGTIEEFLFDGINRLNSLRKAHRAFLNQADVWTIDGKNDHVLIMGRYYDEEKVICLYNFSDQTQTCFVGESKDPYRDLISEKKVSPWEVTLAPYQFMWLKTDFNNI